MVPALRTAQSLTLFRNVRVVRWRLDLLLAFLALPGPVQTVRRDENPLAGQWISAAMRLSEIDRHQAAARRGKMNSARLPRIKRLVARAATTDVTSVTTMKSI